MTFKKIKTTPKNKTLKSNYVVLKPYDHNSTLCYVENAQSKLNSKFEVDIYLIDKYILTETDLKVKNAISEYMLLRGEDVALVGLINNWMEMQSSETVLDYINFQIDYYKQNKLSSEQIYC